MLRLAYIGAPATVTLPDPPIEAELMEPMPIELSAPMEPDAMAPSFIMPPPGVPAQAARAAAQLVAAIKLNIRFMEISLVDMPTQRRRSQSAQPGFWWRPKGQAGR
jgi:hypothetical protein